MFHDVDLLPEDDRNLYTCGAQPRHLSASVDKFNYRLPYKGKKYFYKLQKIILQYLQKYSGACPL